MRQSHFIWWINLVHLLGYFFDMALRIYSRTLVNLCLHNNSSWIIVMILLGMPWKSWMWCWRWKIRWSLYRAIFDFGIFFKERIRCRMGQWYLRSSLWNSCNIRLNRLLFNLKNFWQLSYWKKENMYSSFYWDSIHQFHQQFLHRLQTSKINYQ